MDDKTNEMVIELCKACALSIDRISKETGIDQDFVSKLFIETFQTILKRMDQQEDKQ